MEVLIEKEMIDIKSEPVEVVIMDNHRHAKAPRRRSSSESTQPAELEPCEEFPILYGLLTAPKSFKPRNSEELGLLPVLTGGSPQEMERRESLDGLVVTSRVQLVDIRPRRRSRHYSANSIDDDDDDDEVDSQSLDYCSSESSRSSTNRSPPQVVDSSSNLSAPDRGQDENSSPASVNSLEEDESSSCHHSVNSPASSGASNMGDDCLDDNIPTSTTSGFKRKASRLETAIGNIVKRKGRVQKRSSNNHNNNSVPISMAPSSPTVSTTCVDPPPPSAPRGRSEILERILRSTTTTNTVNPEVFRNSNHSAQNSPVRRNIHDSNNNEGGQGQEEPYAKLRDLLTMPEDQLVKRRRLEYGLSENKVNCEQQQQRHQSPEPMNLGRRRECSPPRNNILASLLQKGRAPYEPSTYHYQSGNGVRLNPPALMSINKLSDNSGSSNSSASINDERPYKCSLCDLRFKKLPLLNRHVKTHSHIKRYVCRFCSHAFKRSDNLLAHMRTSCKGIKEADAKFPGVGSGTVRPNKGNKSGGSGGQIIPQLLSSPPTDSVSPMVSRSQLEEALLNLRHQEQIPEKHYSSATSPSLVSTTTGSPPPSTGSSFRAGELSRRPVPPAIDFQSRHSKLLEILSGSPANNRFYMEDHHRAIVEAQEVSEVEEDEMPLPLSLKVERRSSSPSSSPSSSSSSINHSQFLRSHNQRILYSMMQNRNELPPEEEGDDEEFDDEEEENDNLEPLNLGRAAASASAPPQQPAIQSARSRDHPEIVSILSRQPKNVVMMGPDLRKLVGIDA